MPENRGLENYASPILRCAVFRRLNPGAQIGYEVIPIDEAFPIGHREYEGRATEAVRCTITLADGTFIVAHKEIDTVDRNRQVAQTPEQMAKDETKALGRALRDAGIPQRLTELKDLMAWIATMETGNRVHASSITPAGAPARAAGPAIVDHDADEDSADAGAEDPTSEQVLAQRFARMVGADKAAFAKYAREKFGVANVMRAGEHADELLTQLDNNDWPRSLTTPPTEGEEEPF